MSTSTLFSKTIKTLGFEDKLVTCCYLCHYTVSNKFNAFLMVELAVIFFVILQYLLNLLSSYYFFSEWSFNNFFYQ